MATKVVMEALSPTMEEGRLVKWKKHEGDAVAVGDVLAEVETDKAVMELVARAGGTLLKQVVPAGTTVPVSELVAVIGEPGESGGRRPARRPAATGRQRGAPGSRLPRPKRRGAGTPAAAAGRSATAAGASRPSRRRPTARRGRRAAGPLSAAG